MNLKPILVTSAILLAMITDAPALAAEGPKQDLYRQVKLELRGEASSCLLMSQSYQQLFSEAGLALEGEGGCPGGISALYKARQKASGKYYARQVRAQLKAILRGRVRETDNKTIVRVAYRGTPPGWGYRPQSRTRERFYMIAGEAGFLTDWITTVVRPPVARPAQSR